MIVSAVIFYSALAQASFSKFSVDAPDDAPDDLLYPRYIYRNL